MRHRWYNATGAAAIAAGTHKIAIPAQAVLLNVTLHLNAPGGAVENFTIGINAIDGAAYDTILDTTSMNAVTNVFYGPTVPVCLKTGDVVEFVYANTNTRTWGLRCCWASDH